MVEVFQIEGVDCKWWNLNEFIAHLVKHQHEHIQLRIISEAVCLEALGVFDILDCFEFKQVDIYTANRLQTHDRYNIINPWINIWFKKIPIMELEPYHVWTQKKVFLAYYYRPIGARLGVAAHLLNHYEDISCIHFPYEPTQENMPFFEFNKLAMYRKESMLEVGKLIERMPIKGYPDINLYNLQIGMHYNYHDDLSIMMYRDILVDVLCETHIEGTTFYPTEKVARAMWFKKPFVVFGSKNYLAYLRQMGFKTFWEFWDEGYDSYDGALRFNKVLELIHFISTKSKAELEEMYQAMQPILEHNFRIMKNQSYLTDFTLVKD